MLLNIVTDFIDLIKDNYQEILITLGFVAAIIVSLIVLSVVQSKERRNFKSNIIIAILFIFIMLGINYYLYTEDDIDLYKIIIVNVSFLIFYGLLVLFVSRKRKAGPSSYSVSKIALLGLMSGLAFVFRFFGFPIIPSASFLKLEFSGLIYILVLLWFDFGSAIIVCFITNILRIILHVSLVETTLILGADQLANFISSVAYILPVAIVFYNLKQDEYPSGKKLLLSTLIGSLFAMVFMVVWNYFVNLPIIHKQDWWTFLDVAIIFGSFNIIKWGLVTLVINTLWKKLYNVKYMVSV